jgi:L-rhamnose mutarotase
VTARSARSSGHRIARSGRKNKAHGASRGRRPETKESPAGPKERIDKMNRRFCLTLDLKNNPALIAEYKRYHQTIWPEISQSIRDAGIEDMEIYLLGARMFMIMEVNESFSFEAKARADRANPKVQEWENLMWKFQQSLPEATAGEKWMQMERIFKLEA